MNRNESSMSSTSRCLRRLSALALAVLAVPLLAETTYFPIDGYISGVRPPMGFEVNGRRFEVTSETSFGLIGLNSTSTSSPLREALRIGVYVQVAGSDLGPFKPIKATTVMVRDDWDRKLSGIGVITRVALTFAPATAVYEADGYLIRITPSTQLTFLGDLDSLSDVSANTWLHFSGKRGKDGILEAAKAQFLPAKPTKFKAVKDLEIATVKTRPAGATDDAMTSKATGTLAIPDDGAALQQDEQLKIGLGRWHTLPADQPLQQRVHRIGMALVPAYQRAMADDDPSKIHFRFFAVDDNKLRGAICLLDGAILVSKQTVERLGNDDRLAAVLADGVAYNLQRQAAKQVRMNRAAWGVEIAGEVAGAFVPGLGSAMLMTGGLVGSKDETAMQEERLRIALALMRDAGYDPWQAPEAWRLVTPKKLPANLASLTYPDISCYQFGILNLQYLAAKTANGSGNMRQTSEASERK
jgi:hypothetical protein